MKSYDHRNFSRASVVQFRASRHIMRPNRTSVWKVMAISISREFRCLISSVSIYYKPESDIHVKSYDHLNFTRASVVQFRLSLYVMRLNWTFEFNGHNISHGCPIQAYNISIRSKLNIGNSREQMIMNFHTDVRFWRIICRHAQNWTTEALEKFKWS